MLQEGSLGAILVPKCIQWWGVAQRAWAGQALEGQTDPPWPRGASQVCNQLSTRQEEAGSSIAVKLTLMSTPQWAQPLAPSPAVPLNTLCMGHPHPLVPWGSITTWGWAWPKGEKPALSVCSATWFLHFLSAHHIVGSGLLAGCSGRVL